jgi:hypothetical protein
VVSEDRLDGVGTLGVGLGPFDCAEAMFHGFDGAEALTKQHVASPKRRDTTATQEWSSMTRYQHSPSRVGRQDLR